MAALGPAAGFGAGVVSDPGRAEAQPRRLSLPEGGRALAGSFLVWLAGIAGASLAFHQARARLRQGALRYGRPGRGRCRGGDHLGGVGPGTAGAGRAGRVHAAPCQRPHRRGEGVEAGPGGLGPRSRR